MDQLAADEGRRMCDRQSSQPGRRPSHGLSRINTPVAAAAAARY